MDVLDVFFLERLRKLQAAQRQGLIDTGGHGAAQRIIFQNWRLMEGLQWAASARKVL